MTAGLALRSLRHRSTAFGATFVTVMLSAAVVGSFATLFTAANGPAVSPADAETLQTMGGVVGGWGLLIVLFSVASTVGIIVSQRNVEIGVLRTIGATPARARQLLRVETMAVCLIAALVGAALAAGGGRVLLAALESSNLIEAAEYQGGIVPFGATVVGLLAVCLAASSIAGRKATRGTPSVAPAEVPVGRASLPKWRYAFAAFMILGGTSMAIVTVTVTKDATDPYEAMMTSGSNSIVIAMALAALAPLLLRWGAKLARPWMNNRRAETHLAAHNTARRAHLLAGVLAPVIILTSVSVGTLMLVGIDGRTVNASVPDGDTVTLLNNVVVSMLCIFAAIMVVNAFAAVVAHRRAELRRLWLLGATRTQVRRSIVVEAAVVAGVGVVVGMFASLWTIIPFAIARDEGLVPNGQLWLPLALGVAIFAFTLLVARGAARRVVASALA